ncbi:hypothetical protein ACFL6S_30045 [Candidatus Poribacteria bacterium]
MAAIRVGAKTDARLTGHSWARVHSGTVQERSISVITRSLDKATCRKSRSSVGQMGITITQENSSEMAHS